MSSPGPAVPPEEKPTGSAGSPATPTATEDEKGTSPQANLNVQVGPTDNSTITIKQSVEFRDERKALLPELERVSVFSPRVGVSISQGDEISSASLFVHNKEFVKDTLTTLTRSRVLLLVGEADTGKEAIARYLAKCLREGGTLERDTLLFPPLASDMRLSLHSALATQRELRGRVIIFRDILERGNPGLRDFLALMKGEAVTNVGRTLEQVNSYVILTSAAASLPPDCATYLPARVRPVVPTLPHALLREGIEKRIVSFLKQHGDPALRSALTPELTDEIAARAGTMSRAVRLIDSRLSTVLRGDMSVQQAFDELDALSSWFHNSADSDREAWIYALALILCHSLGRDDDVPWSEFSVMYDEIRTHVLRWRKAEVTERPLDEDRLRVSAGAEIKRDSVLARDLIAFKEPGAARRLWDVLLAGFRPLANSLSQVLLRLTTNDSVAIRARAAQALGRIGRVDAAAMAGHWLQDWADSDAYQQRALAGYLTQAALSTGDADYRLYMLDLLDRFARSRERVWTAIAAYKQIGMMDLPLALEKLKAIAESRLAPAFEQSREVGRRIDQLDRNLASFRTVEATLTRQILGELRTFYLESFERESEIAASFKYSIVSLSMTSGLAPVLAALSRWTLGASGLGALVCLVFLQDGGIADELTKRDVEVVLHGSSGPEAVSCNIILASIIDDSQSVQTLVRFLQTMYAGLLDFFPPDAAVLLTHIIFEYLKMWVRASLSVPQCRAAMVEMIGRLLQSNLKEMYERTYDWLMSDSDFASGEMAAFAKDARRLSIRVN